MITATSPGSVPAISITAESLPQAWEKTVLAVWDNGVEVKTQYDKPGDRPSKDATVMVTVTDPLTEPRIHKNFPGGPAELESYRQEVLYGIHDHWIDPSAGKWTYTYHERLFAYCPVEDLSNANAAKPFSAVDQIRYIIETLASSGHSRRAQGITWMPTADPKTDDPPCLQRIWCRLIDDGTNLVLNMNTHWRSRDLYKAWFMNVYAMTDLQRVIAEELTKKTGRDVKVGRYVDISDSLHIYGAYFDSAEKEVEKMRKSPFTDRAWSSNHPAFKVMTEEAREKLSGNVDYYAKPQGTDG